METVKKRLQSRELYLSLLSVLFVLAITVAIYIFRDTIAEFENYGYAGVFLANIISCATIIVPVPGWFLTFAMGGILDSLLIGIISGLGATVGEMTGYLLGYAGRIGIENARAYDKMVDWMTSRGAVTIFLFALIPNPMADVAGIAAGALRYSLWKYIFFGSAGRVIKYVVIAFAGAWGFDLVLDHL